MPLAPEGRILPQAIAADRGFKPIEENAEVQVGGLPSGNQRAAGRKRTIIETALENHQV